MVPQTRLPAAFGTFSGSFGSDGFRSADRAKDAWKTAVFPLAGRLLWVFRIGRQHTVSRKMGMPQFCEMLHFYKKPHFYKMLNFPEALFVKCRFPLTEMRGSVKLFLRNSL